MNHKEVFREIERMGYEHSISFTTSINYFIKGKFRLGYFRPNSDEGDHIIAIETGERFTRWSEARVRVSFTSLRDIKNLIKEAEKELDEKN